MKKRIATLLLMSVMALSLGACGDADAPDPIDTQQSTPEDTAEPKPTTEPADAPTAEPEEESSPESTDGSAEDPASAPAADIVEGLPEDRAWIDDLYEKLIAYNVDAVLEILHDPDLKSKAEPYLFPEYAEYDDEAGYKLYTTDYKVVGLITEGDCVFAFYSEHEDQGFESIKSGDILIGFESYNGIEHGMYSDGVTAIYESADLILDLSDPTINEFFAWHTYS